MADLEYCPRCSQTIEYDPCNPELFPKFDCLIPCQCDVKNEEKIQVEIPKVEISQQLDIDLNAVMALITSLTNRVREVISCYSGDLFNTSAVFMLRRARTSAAPEQKRQAHLILREYQCTALRITQAELTAYGAAHMNARLIKAIKNYDKDLFNLSPIWALKLSGIKTQRTTDFMLAMSTVDLLLKARGAL